MKTKHLIKDNSNQIHNVFEGALVDVTANIINPNDITQLEYEEYGVDNVSDFPLDELNLMEEFEILAWTDDKEAVLTLELTVPEYNLLDDLERPISVITCTDGEDVPQLKSEYSLQNVGTRIMKRG